MDEGKIRCSVGITAYNEEANIGRLLQAIIDQRLYEVEISEIIVVASGCTDRTEEIAHQVRAGAPPGKSVSVLSSPENRGAADALWLGFAVATGHYLTFLAADDAYVDPDHLARQVEAIQAAGECPSGRLTAVTKEGELSEPDYDPEIDIVEDPERGVSAGIFVKGKIPIESEDGEIYELRNRVALCRCGHSRNKPFCDASHVPFGFSDGHVPE